VAQSATIYNFDIELAHVDRDVYETLSLRVACQPWETPEYLLTRVLAYCLEFTEGISFGKGLAEPGEPALSVRDFAGALKVWVEALAGERIHRAEALEVYSLDREMLAAMVARLERRTAFALSVSDAHRYITIGDETFAGPLERHMVARA
jgi:uncharacterized protein YaeQ